MMSNSPYAKSAPVVISGLVALAFSAWVAIATHLGLHPVLETGAAVGGPAIALSLTYACKYAGFLFRH